MKILAVSYLFPNSQQPNFGIFVLNRLKAVSNYCEVKVINPIPGFPGSTLLSRYRPYRKVPLVEQLQGLEVYHPRFLSFPRVLKTIEPFTFRRAVCSAIQLLQERFPFDILDVHWIFPDLPACLSISESFGKKIIATLRGKEALLGSGERRFRRLLIPALDRTDHIISLSQEMIELCKNGGVIHDRFSLIRNGVDTKKFYWIDRDSAREKLKLPKDRLIILSVGALIHRKGYDRIIKFLPRLAEEFPNVTLYILGDAGPEGNHKKDIKRICIENHVEDKVFFMGAVSNESLVWWYNAVDVFCLASRGEGSPNVLSEALACGCPSVATKVGSAEDILEYPWMGELIPNDDNSVYDGLRIALRNRYDRKRIAAYMAQYDWDWCAKQVIDVYQSVMEQNH